MKVALIEIAALIAIIGLVSIAVVKAIPRELHRQNAACQTMQRDGYQVKCNGRS